jgi:predicted DNA-binding transcriptional regulator AlpA
MSVQSTGRSKDEKRRARQDEKRRAHVDDPLALITKRELAELLRITPWTVDYWRKRGRLPKEIVLSPQKIAWRRCDIAQWQQERQNNPAATLAVRDRKRERRR